MFAVAQGFSLCAGLGLQVLVARRLTTDDFGRFAIAGTVVLALTLGLVSAIPKALARVVSIDRSLLPIAWRRVWMIQMPVSLLVAMTLATVSIGGLRYWSDDLLGIALAVVALELVFRAGVLEPGWGLLNGVRRYRTQAGLMLLHSVLRVVFVGIAIVWGAGLNGCLLALAGNAVLSTLILVAVVGALCHESRGVGTGVDERASKSSLLSQAELVRWVRWAPAAEVLNYVVVASNLWLVKVFLDDASGVGVYAACFSLAAAVMPFGIAVSRGTFASFAAMINDKNTDQASILLQQVLRGMFIVGSCGVCTAFVLGTSIVAALFGIPYRPDGHLLGMLVTGTYGIALVWMLGDVFNAAGALRTRLAVMIGLTAFSIGSVATLAPIGGSMGAALALMLTGIVGTAAMLAAVVRFLPGCIPAMTFARCSVAGAIAFLIGRSVAVPETLVGVVGGAMALCVVQLSCLLLLREWSFGELRSSWQFPLRGIQLLRRPTVLTSFKFEECPDESM